MSELKPCPFCGGQARIFTKRVHSENHHLQLDVKCEYIVKCNRCRASMSCYASKAWAINAWNRRADNEQKN